MKKLLASALIALTAPLALVTPAGAAIPQNKPPAITLACQDGTGRVARVWSTNRQGTFVKLAADNPCARTLVLIWNHNDGSEASANILGVAPGAHFHRHVKFSGDNLGARMDEAWRICDGHWQSAWYVAPNKHGRILPADAAPACQ